MNTHDCEACSGTTVQTAAGPRVVCEKDCPLRLQRIRDEDAYYHAWKAWNEDPDSHPHPGPNVARVAARIAVT